MTTDAVAAQLETDPSVGLSPEAVVERTARYGPNQLDAAETEPRWRVAVRQFQDPLVYLLGASVVVSLAAWLIEGAEGVPFEVLVIVGIVVANAVLGFVQESRAERAIQALQQLTAQLATVIRDGTEQRVPAHDIVPGDVLVLAEGDAVAADARLFEVSSLTVAEAALTGESEAITKTTEVVAADAVLGDRTNMVFGGTAVARGRGKAVVTATGMTSEMGNIARMLGETTDQRTPLQLEVERIGRQLGVAVVGVAVIVVVAILATNDIDGLSGLVDVLLVGVSLAVAAVPEGLPALLSVVLAVGVQRMAGRRAIVKRLASVETLGSASVICSDKTGTLTRNEMSLVEVATADGDTTLGSDDVGTAAARVVTGGALANEAWLAPAGSADASGGDATDVAFLLAERALGTEAERTRRFHRTADFPFTSERKLMTAIHLDTETQQEVATTKGAPDVLLERCSHELADGVRRPLTESRRAAITTQLERLAAGAMRTIAVAQRDLPPGTDRSADGIERDLTHLGVAGLLDPPRSEASDAVAAAHRAGIRVVMITGDHPLTALRIAQQLGIATADEAALSGREIEDMDDAAFAEAVRRTDVFARVAPEHKLRIVRALQADGEIVSMTGDGVNDAPALRAADIGVAMGVTGTDVSKEAADMILADDNFATIVGAVREGRAILGNIRTFLRYLLSSNIAEVFTMFFGVVLAGTIGLRDTGLAAPLLATQILWINLLTDTAPALAMGFDPPAPDVMERPPRRRSEPVVDPEMWGAILFTGVVMATITLIALRLHLPGELDLARTMAFTTLVLAQLFNCFNARSTRRSAFATMFTNRLLWAAILVSLALQIAVVHVPVLQSAFSTQALSWTQWLTCTGLASVVLWADELRKLVVRLAE